METYPLDQEHTYVSADFLTLDAVAYMTAVSATIGAVSQRRIRSPMEQM